MYGQFARKRRFCIAFFSLIMLTIVLNKILSLFSADNSCPKGYAGKKLNEMCQKYKVGEADGRLCMPLCKHKDIVVNSCIRHHLYTVVMKAMWGNIRIVLKQKLKEDNALGSANFEETKISDAINEMLGLTLFRNSKQKKTEVLNSVQERLSKELGILGRERNRLINQKEFMFLSIFQNQSHISQLYGSCGSLYAVEYEEPLSNFFPEVISRNHWSRKVRITLSLLDLLKDFYNAPFGPLIICDMKTSDLGVRKDDSIVVIDYDMIFTKRVLDDFISQPNCLTNKDCDFFDCKSECDIRKRKCTSRMTTNNLQILCQKILLPTWPERGILHGLPQTLASSLFPLLQKCVSAEFGALSFDSIKVSTTSDEIYKKLQLALK